MDYFCSSFSFEFSFKTRITSSKSRTMPLLTVFLVFTSFHTNNRHTSVPVYSVQFQQNEYIFHHCKPMTFAIFDGNNFILFVDLFDAFVLYFLPFIYSPSRYLLYMKRKKTGTIHQPFQLTTNSYFMLFQFLWSNNMICGWEIHDKSSNCFRREHLKHTFNRIILCLWPATYILKAEHWTPRTVSVSIHIVCIHMVGQ